MAPSNFTAPIRKPEQLVPHCRLIQNQSEQYGGTNGVKVIGSVRNYSPSHDSKDIIGLNDVQIRCNLGSITCDVSFPMHQEMFANKANDSQLGQLFSIQNTWEIEYGWSSENKRPNKIKNMRLVNWNLEYDYQRRMFMANMTLVPNNGYILGDIKIMMLQDALTEIQKTIGAEDLKNSTVKISLGKVMTTLLDGCKKLIEGYSGGSGTTVQYETQKYEMAFSDRFKVATIDDIPSPEEIVLVLFGDDASSWNPEAVHWNFKYGGIDNPSVMDKLTDKSNLDLSVMQFLNTLLDDNGFIFSPRAKTTDDGSITWMVLQSEFNNAGQAFNQSEFVGITANPNELPNSPAGNPNMMAQKYVFAKPLNLISFGKRDENIFLFDLHSTRHIVTSVQASTEVGDSTIFSFMATDNAVMTDQSIGVGRDMNNYRNSIYKMLSVMSKELTFETIGFQEANPFDSIDVKLAGDLYSGKYLIVEMSHKIGKTYSSTIKAVRTSTGIKTNNLPTGMGEEPIVEIPTITDTLIKLIPESPDVEVDSRLGGYSPNL